MQSIPVNYTSEFRGPFRILRVLFFLLDGMWTDVRQTFSERKATKKKRFTSPLLLKPDGKL
jgi:hypothetical protein